MNAIINNILDFTGGEKFYRFGNADGKYWVVPARGMRTALNLYQPSGVKGKMVKALLPYLHCLAPVRKAIKAQSVNCRLNSELHGLLCKVFGVQDIEFAIFEGTPSVHQKITMQLSQGNRILGYCKLSTNNDIKELFEKESDTLDRLCKSGVTGIPAPLYCGTLSSGTHIFVQSTKKSASSRVIHEWGNLQDLWTTQLYEKTRQKVKFEDSDFYRSLNVLEEHLNWLPTTVDKKQIGEAITNIRNEYHGKVVEFSAHHGDFTPWNTFVEKGELFVFDFEYTALTYPPGLDKYHFLTQTNIFEKKGKNITHYNDITRHQHLCYLLSILSLYVNRNKGIYDSGLENIIKSWVDTIIALK